MKINFVIVSTLAVMTVNSALPVMANPICRDLLERPTAEHVSFSMPETVEDLIEILPHQYRVLPNKETPLLVLKASEKLLDGRLLLDDPTYKTFMADTVEVMISGTGKPYRHIVLRVGDVVYAYNKVMDNTVGEKFRIGAEDKKDKKGVVFYVGREKIKALQAQLVRFYGSSPQSNVPPFSANAGNLILKKVLNTWQLEPEKGGFVPAYARETVDAAKNTKAVYGKFLKVAVPADARIRGVEMWDPIQFNFNDPNFQLVLESPQGVRAPVMKNEKGELYLTGLSCNSSAALVLTKMFGLDLEAGKSAVQLVDGLLKGNLGHDAAPVALVLYGPEKAKLTNPMTEALGARPKLQIAAPVVADVVAPVVEVQPAVQPELKKEDPVVEVAAPAPAMPIAVPAPEANGLFGQIPEAAPAAAPAPAPAKKGFLGRLRGLFGND